MRNYSFDPPRPRNSGAVTAASGLAGTSLGRARRHPGAPLERFRSFVVGAVCGVLVTAACPVAPEPPDATVTPPLTLPADDVAPTPVVPDDEVATPSGPAFDPPGWCGTGRVVNGGPWTPLAHTLPDGSTCSDRPDECTHALFCPPRPPRFER